MFLVTHITVLVRYGTVRYRYLYAVYSKVVYQTDGLLRGITRAHLVTGDARLREHHGTVPYRTTVLRIVPYNKVGLRP